MKYIFVTGGVVSGLGKGICAASLGRLLKQCGLRVKNQKFDPYLNVDPGTMSPYQHGEVFVTDDGAETDLDLGHYERFVDEALNANASVSSGKVYWSVLNRERQGGEFQERHTAAGFGVATVGERRHGRVHERVEESGEGGDAAHHGHDAEHNQALRHEYGLTLGDGLLIGLIEIHEPVGDNAGKQRPAELADRKRPHFGDGEISDG